MRFELIGRIPSKKNSKRRIKRGNAIFMVPSAAYERWHTEQSRQLLAKRPKTPLAGPLALTLHLYLKGRIDQDLDNAVASIADLFQDAAVIENDKQLVELHLYKHPGNHHFFATVDIEAAASAVSPSTSS